jgi:uncharacterized OB-fold protein
VYGNRADGVGTRHLGDGRYLELRVADSAARTWRSILGADSVSTHTVDTHTAGTHTAGTHTAGTHTAGTHTAGTVTTSTSTHTAGTDTAQVPDAVTGVAAAAAARACGAGPDAVLPDHGVAGPLLALLKAAGTGAGRTVHTLATTAGRVVAVAAVAAQADLDAPSWQPPREIADDPLERPTEPDSSPQLSLPTSSPFFRRAARELLRLEGGRCRGCGHVTFPPSQRPVCSGCGSFDFEPAALSRTGSVYSYVVNRFMPQGFGEEVALVLGEMDDGSRYWAPTSGMDTAGLAIGDPVELRLRRFTGHGGAPAYAMKFVSRESVR